MTLKDPKDLSLFEVHDLMQTMRSTDFVTHLSTKKEVYVDVPNLTELLKVCKQLERHLAYIDKKSIVAKLTPLFFRSDTDTFLQTCINYLKEVVHVYNEGHVLTKESISDTQLVAKIVRQLDEGDYYRYLLIEVIRKVSDTYASIFKEKRKINFRSGSELGVATKMYEQFIHHTVLGRKSIVLLYPDYSFHDFYSQPK